MTDMNETNLSHALPGQERYVAPLEETPLKDVDSVDESVPASSLWADAWRTLRKNPMFIISAVLIVFIIFVALFPGVMTKQNPNYCTLENSLESASKGHPFGFDLQGCDVYSRVVYGTRTSLSVGVFATVLVVLLGTLIGALSGFFGGWVDGILSRLTDIFLALPILLGAIVVLQMFKTNGFHLEDYSGHDVVRLDICCANCARRCYGSQESGVQYGFHRTWLNAMA